MKRQPQASVGRNRGAQQLPDLDYTLLAAALALVGFGLVMVASASLHLADRSFNAPFFYVIRHLIALCIGFAAAAVVARVPLKLWERAGTFLYFVGLLLLVLVLMPGLGREANGAVRWIPVGPFSLQSSELMKFFAVVYIAAYLVRRREEVARTLWGFVKPMILLMVACSLILMEPDFGTATVMLGTALGMLFLGGVPVWQFLVLLGMAGISLGALVLYSPYRLQRVTTFLDPWADPLNAGYQLTQALIAFGRGEWFGVGLGNGIQKQFYLPEAHTDFLLAVIGEEFGLAGTITVIFLFGFIVWKGFRIGARAERQHQLFGAYVAYGLAIWVGLQAFVNIGVNVGLLPTKGLTLPLMSYGGNSIIVACVLISMLLRIDLETRQITPPDVLERTSWSRA
jgi:cell division protein FtsW